MSSILILAPWWQHEAHVGNLRLRRHVAWLREAGFRVTIVDSGLHFSLSEESGVTRITIPDPLRMHVAPQPGAQAPRKPNAMRRWLAYALLLPDPSIVWARRVLAHPVVRHTARTCTAVMSSSPPEAAFMACAALSQRYGIPFWMDMRDGWLDEPLKPLLRSSTLQRWREARLETQCLHSATVVTVTSQRWADMLLARHPEFAQKVHVLTNAAPGFVGRPMEAASNPTIIYAGRLRSSRPERDSGELENVVNKLHRHRFSIIGDLTSEEREDASLRGWTVEAALPRQDLLETLSLASGLILLSASMGSIPAKFFDYLATGRPILGIAPRGSAAWDILSRTPHAFPVAIGESSDAVISEFEAAMASPGPSPIPSAYTEESVRTRFMEVLACL